MKQLLSFLCLVWRDVFVKIFDLLLVRIWIEILLVRILINFSLSLLTFVSFLFGILGDSFILFIHLFFSVRLRLPISSLIFHFALLLFLIIFLDGIEGWYLIFYSLAIIFFVFSLPPLKKQVVLTVIFSLFNRDTLRNINGPSFLVPIWTEVLPSGMAILMPPTYSNILVGISFLMQKSQIVCSPQFTMSPHQT